jgi:hypothetical protein
MPDKIDDTVMDVASAYRLLAPCGAREVVILHPLQCEMHMSNDRIEMALGAACRRLCSTVEWSWTDEEILAMAEFVLFSAQKQAAIAQIVNSGIKHLPGA